MRATPMCDFHSLYLLIFLYPGIVHRLRSIPTYTTRVSPANHCLSTPFLTNDLIIMVALVIDVTPYFQYPSGTRIEGEPTFMTIMSTTKFQAWKLFAGKAGHYHAVVEAYGRDGAKGKRE